MDVDMEMNGHATSLAPSSQPESSLHLDSNMAATTSNAESSISTLPAKPLVTVPPVYDATPVKAPSPQHEAIDTTYSTQSSVSHPTENGFYTSSTASASERPLNGTHLNTEVNDNPSVLPERPTQAHVSIFDVTPPAPHPETSSHPISAFDHTATTSSTTADNRMQTLTAPHEQPVAPPTEISAILNQAPISDLRTTLSLPAGPSDDAAMKIQTEKESQDVAQSLAIEQQEPAQPISPVASALPHEVSPGAPHIPEISEAIEMDTSYSHPSDIAGDPSPFLLRHLRLTPAAATLPSDQPQETFGEPLPVPPPSEKPEAPEPTPVAPAPAADQSMDLAMPDVPSPPTKIAREREEDADEEEPSAKRARTDGDSEQAEFKVPHIPSNSQSPGVASGASERVVQSTNEDEDDEVTPSRLAHMKKIISNLKKSNASAHFRLPVDAQALGIPQYHDIIKQPMDLSKIDAKLKNGEYTTVKEFTTDFRLIVDNSVTFNGAEHAVSQSAYKMQSSFDNQIANMPKPGVSEAAKEEKKAYRTKIEPTRSAPPRRPSVSTTTVQTMTAKSPSTTTPAQTFAVGPEGVPLIRRDSTIQDGRPKRAIVAPKRNEFGGGRPKKKKFELQLKFCAEVLKEIYSAKHWSFAQYFLFPVDPVALNIPTYFQIIKKPMDFGTVQQKLDGNVYEKAKDFEEDCRLVFKNCYKFNPEGEFVNQCGHKLEEVFDKKWATKDDWIASREPPSEPQSPTDDEDEEEEEESEEEEENDESEDERQRKILMLQKQIEDMSKQMGELAQPKKKKKSTPPVPQKKAKSSKSAKKDKLGSTFPNLKPKEKKKSISKPKEKEKFVNISFAEKQYISNGISQLPDKQMNEALKIIQQNVPHLKNTHETEIELDIEEVPNHVLHKLLTFVKKYAGPPPEESRPDPMYSTAPAPSKPKKNKPMSKHEQEAQIEELKGKLGVYAGGPVSPDAVQSIETGAESSDDEADSEESEEE